MQPPVYGNNAYKYYEERNTVTRKKVRRVKKTVKTDKNTLRGIGVVAIVTAAAFCLLFRYAVMLDKTTQIAQLQEQLDSLTGQVVSKQFDIESQIDLKSVEEIAVTKLGMQRPSKAQTVYVDMNNSDYAEAPAVPKEKETSFLSSIKDKFLKYLG